MCLQKESGTQPHVRQGHLNTHSGLRVLSSGVPPSSFSPHARRGRCGLFGAGGGDPPFLSPLPRSPPPPSLPRSLSLLCSAMMPRSHQPPPPPHGAAGRGPALGPPRDSPFVPGPRAAPPYPHPKAGPSAALCLELGRGGGAGKHAAGRALGPGCSGGCSGRPRLVPTWGGYPVAAARRESWRGDQGVGGSLQWLLGQSRLFCEGFLGRGAAKPGMVTGNEPRNQAPSRPLSL